MLRGWILLAAAWSAAGASSYRASVDASRQQREASLKAPDGWLSLAGLFWLKEGPNTVGSAPGSDVRLPAGAPARVGVFEFHNGTTSFQVSSGAAVTRDGVAFTSGALKPDSSGQPDILRAGRVSMFVIERAGRYGIRVKDPESDARKHFRGLKWYPVSERWRVEADFHAYNPPRKISVPDILGDTLEEPSPGYAEFRLDGQTLRLDAVVEGDGLFFIFRDRTAGRTTYGSGRFLDAAMPKNGKVLLDFNLAYNPPCSFTPYATCPLPPAQNRLSVAIPAGELEYGSH